MNANLAIPWETVAEQTQLDPDFCALLVFIHDGFPSECPESDVMRSFWQYRNAIYEEDGVIMYDDRIVVPPSLREKVLNTFHAAHQGVSTMESRARELVFWPGMSKDFDRIRSSCGECIANAPSQPKLPPAPFDPPCSLFEKIVADFFNAGGHNYLVIADRLSSWTEVFKCTAGSPQSGAEGLIECLRNVFMRFGVPVELSSDGGPEFVASKTKDFLRNWGINHRLSSAYHPQSNGRAEVAVKSAKRLLRSNTGSSGSLNTDKFLLAMLQLRNTPDLDCNLAPSQILFGRPLRDAFSFASRLEKFSNPNYLPLWRDAWEAKEQALRCCYHRSAEVLKEHSRLLKQLEVGDRCYLQNLEGNHPRRWDRSGKIVEVLGHDSYLVKIDGSGRLTRRNRKHLRKFEPVSPTFSLPPQLPLSKLQVQEPKQNKQPLRTQSQMQASAPVQHANQNVDVPLIEAQEAAAPPLPVEHTNQRPQRTKKRPLQYDAYAGKWK